MTRLKIDGSTISPDQSTGSLAPSADEFEFWTWTATAGAHTLQMCADATSAVSESNEFNNCFSSIPFTVTAACSGPISLSLSPNPTTAGTPVTPTASGLSGCSGQSVDFRLTNCSGSLVNSCSVGGDRNNKSNGKKQK